MYISSHMAMFLAIFFSALTIPLQTLRVVSAAATTPETPYQTTATTTTNNTVHIEVVFTIFRKDLFTPSEAKQAIDNKISQVSDNQLVHEKEFVSYLPYSYLYFLQPVQLSKRDEVFVYNADLSSNLDESLIQSTASSIQETGVYGLTISSVSVLGGPGE